MVSNAQIEWNTSGDELVEMLKPDLAEKVIIVTGPNSGIGLETARILAGTGAKIIIPYRTLEKAHRAIEHIKQTVPRADLIAMQLDLSDTVSIRSFAK
ncbi:hypothetical protein MFLAVUS_006839 [Mucor flavus]|uniref:Uncharacterized protein n=1 Tax=Mucor flavus TaxID=439312 RepID=A0ABP9Z2N0_9FUNG